MRIVKSSNNYFKYKHIFKNHLKNVKSNNNFPVLYKNGSLVKLKSNNRLQNNNRNSINLVDNTNPGLLTRYLDNIKCNVNVWGSSLAELEVKLDSLRYLRSRNRFLRKFSKIELVSNGSKFIPNEVQLFSLRPQLTGSDLLINSPKGSGKTFLYLLPHLMYNYLFNNYYNHVYNTYMDLMNQKVVVLLPTIDLVVDDSRTANGCFKKHKKVASLLYKNLALNDFDHILDSDVIYSTPKSFLKLLVRDTSIRSSVRFIVVDEAERMVIGEFAYLLVRIKNLLPVDSQFVFLSNFNHNQVLNQFISRFSKLNFKIISFVNGSENRNRVLRHIYGPIRSIPKHVTIYNSINSHELKDDTFKLNLNDTQTLESNSTEPNELNITDNDPLDSADPFPGDIVRRLELKVKKNRDLLLNVKNRVALNDYKIDYVLYEPSRFLEALLSELDPSKKTLVYFPTVRMCQFCYVYLKHYLRAFDSNYGQSIGEFGSESCDNSEATDDVTTRVNFDKFMFYDFHTGLSLEKRRYVLDNFKLATRGFLFCTNLAIGINFYNVNKIIQVSFCFDIYELLNKFSHPVRTINGQTSNINGMNNDQESDGKSSIETVLLLNNLDGHILYEYYKNNISVSYKNSFSSASNEPTTDKSNINADIYLINSCELMYRSLLGYYSENAQRLKLERWMIPSFFNEFLKSFGIYQTFSVSRQFAARTQLLDSPGLEVSRSSNRKSELIAALKAYPGFISKSRQSNISV